MLVSSRIGSGEKAAKRVKGVVAIADDIGACRRNIAKPTRNLPGPPSRRSATNSPCEVARM